MQPLMLGRDTYVRDRAAEWKNTVGKDCVDNCDHPHDYNKTIGRSM